MCNEDLKCTSEKTTSKMAVIISGGDYDKYFDPDKYMENMYSEVEACNDFVLKELHHIFNEGGVKGDRLLDIGTGPTIHGVISASSSVNEIYLSDFADVNIKILTSWLNGEREIQNNMTQFICNLENSQYSTDERVSILRNKVKKIFFFDITSLDSLQGKEVPETYNVITSSWCLDSAGFTRDKYLTCAKNIFTLLNPGGHLVLTGDLNSKPYKIGKDTFPLVTLSSEDLQTIYKDIGFNILGFKTCSYSGDIDNAGMVLTTFVMVAQKPSK